MGDDSWLVLQGGGSPAWIDVPERSKSTFMELKRRKVHQYVIFKIDDRKEEIIIEKTGAPGESYDDFTASLPADDCRYAVYDLDFVSDDNCRKSTDSVSLVICLRDMCT
jgi:cofilin